MVPSMRIIPIIAVPMDEPRFALVDKIPDASDCLSDPADDNTILPVIGSARPNPIPKSNVPGIRSIICVFKLNWKRRKKLPARANKNPIEISLWGEI